MECLSVISCVYSGKSKEDLLSSQEAVEAQVKLQAVLRYMAAKVLKRPQKAAVSPPPETSAGGDDHKGTASPSHVRAGVGRNGDSSPKTAFHHLEGITIQLAEEEVKTDERERAPQASSLRPKPGSAGKSSLATRDRNLQPKESSSMLLDDGKGGSRKVIPREWYVLSYPLPEVSSVPQSLLATLKHSVKEARFHESIYYSKKNV